MVKVKICGVTSARDARLAARLGADAIGFNFYKRSPRFITKEKARAILAALPPFVTAVGVFVNDPADVIRETCAYVGLDTAQLHGEETPRVAHALTRLTRIKAVRVAGETDVARLSRYQVEAYLLDAFVPGRRGGTGVTFNWELAREAQVHGPIVLAGGLTPENVQEAIRVAAPFAVDVASGVESAPGVKDRDLLEAFIRLAKTADNTGAPLQE